MSLIVSILFGLCPAAFCSQTGSLFTRAKKEARAGASDFAYMHYRAMLRENPNTRYRKELLFAQGEYLFWMSDYGQAEGFFNLYLNEKTRFEEKLFALTYLLKIAERDKKSENIKDLQDQIRSLRTHTFIFRDAKQYALVSPFYRKLKAVYSIEGIEIYVDKTLLTKISY